MMVWFSHLVGAKSKTTQKYWFQRLQSGDFDVFEKPVKVCPRWKWSKMQGKQNDMDRRLVTSEVLLEWQKIAMKNLLETTGLLSQLSQ